MRGYYHARGLIQRALFLVLIFYIVVQHLLLPGF